MPYRMMPKKGSIMRPAVVKWKKSIEIPWVPSIFYRNRSLEKWEEKFQKDPSYAKKSFPSIIEQGLAKRKLTASEAETLLSMIMNGKDTETLLLAVAILKEKFKKYPKK